MAGSHVPRMCLASSKIRAVVDHLRRDFTAFMMSRTFLNRRCISIKLRRRLIQTRSTSQLRRIIRTHSFVCSLLAFSRPM